MSDSTAIIDTTAFIYIPPVPDATGATTVELVAANSLTNEFSNQSAPLENQANKVSSSLDSIKNSISGISPGDYTPAELLDSLATQSLDAAFKSTAWLVGENSLADLQDVKARCVVFGSSDLSEMVGDMASGVLDDAMGAIDDVADSMKSDFPGLSIPELGIAKSLSDIINTGRTAFDQTKTAFSGAVSSALEHGKAGLAIAENAISKVGAAVTDALTVDKSTITAITGALKGLDDMINCADSLGGSALSSKTTEMVDKSNEIFDKLGVESDPNSLNFGEFDENAYLDSIGGMTSQQKSNVLKLTNVYNKSTNNAGTAVDKAKRDSKPSIEFEKSTSSLATGSNQAKVEDKVNYVVENTPVVVEVPPVPVVAAQAPTAISPTVTPATKSKSATSTSPVPIPTAIISTAAPAIQKPKVILFSNLFERIALNVVNGNYDDFDPDHVGIPKYQAALMSLMPPGGIEETKIGTKVVVGLIGIGQCEADYSTISSSINWSTEAQVVFSWAIAYGPNQPYNTFLSNRGVGAGGVIDGSAWEGPFSGQRHKDVNAERDTMIEAVLDAIYTMKLVGGKTDKYMKILFEKNPG
jgi:hypothetical protein